MAIIISNNKHIIYSKKIGTILTSLRISLLTATNGPRGPFFITPGPNGLKVKYFPHKEAKAVAYDRDRLAIAAEDKIYFYRMEIDGTRIDLKRMGSIYTNKLDIHDLYWHGQNLVAVNTEYSCLSEINPKNKKIKKFWQPFFITEVTAGDRTHLNGLLFENGVAEYATALGRANSHLGWKKNYLNGGILINIAKNSIVKSGLSMPHSPRKHSGKIYLLCSSKGTLCEFNPKTKKSLALLKVNHFLRGLCLIENYAFVGISKIREGSKIMEGMGINRSQNFAGLAVVDIKRKKVLGYIKLPSTCEEVYNINIIKSSV